MRIKRRKRKVRIGIFGGTFNPFHNGHIKIIDSAIKELDLDKLYVVPVGKPSHKREDKGVRKKARYKMVVKGLKGRAKVEVSTIEIRNKKTSYTYDTLKRIRKKEKGSIFFEIIGGDSASYVESWKNYKKMVKKCYFAYVVRSGSEIKGKGMKKINMEPYDISSTEIREKIKNNISVEGDLSKEVYEFIKRKKIYN